MHELGIAQDLFAIVKEKAKENNLKKVTKISIKVGVTSGIKKDFLKHSLVDHIFPKTIAQGARLELIEELPAARCKDCGKAIDAQSMPTLNCPTCGSFKIEITKGKDVYLESIEGDT